MSSDEFASKPPASFGRGLVLWLAQGLGVGRIPWAPGTFGSLLGLGWFAVLLLIAQWSPVSAVLLFLAGVFASVWTCEAAEVLLGRKDPGSVVLDEIVALPTCFLGWVFHLWLQLGAVPSLDLFFGGTTWFLALGVFLAFRFFDVVKPWPVRDSQSLPGGWGVVVDDQLAAVYVNLVVLVVHVALQVIS
jgi:phosphatidylglycerophosphatase A